MEAIEKALRLKAELDAMGELDGEQKARIMQKLRLDWNYHSNHLEGNSLTYGETKALLLFGITAQGKPLQDHFEITGHNEAINMVMDVVKEERPLTEMFIRQINELLLKGAHQIDAITPDGKPTKKTIYPGQYKTQPNHVLTVTGEIFRFATPEETPAKMHDLVEWFKEKKASGLDPILLAAEFHYKFVRIHPFDDGNGRTARILMNFILMQNAYPPVIIRTEDKKNYIARLEMADAGSIDPFIEYIAENLNRSLEIMIKGANGENIDEPDDIDKQIALLDQRLKNFDKKIKTVKSKASIGGLLTQTLIPFYKRFIEVNGKFLSYYKSMTTTFRVFQENNSERILTFPNSQKDILKVYAKQIDENDHRLTITCKFNEFKKLDFDNFDFVSQYSFFLGRDFYSICNLEKKEIIMKSYSDLLTNDDFEKILKVETNRHIEFIELKLKQQEDKIG